MRTKAVIDLGFGDSGKGTFTSYLCQNLIDPLVIRFSGGHQAGHTVIKNGVRHVFSSFGSGTMIGVPTFWSRNCTFHPTGFLNELGELINKEIYPKIYVDGRCPITTPCDINHNRRMESKNKHGSCGVGFGATLEREEKYYSLLVEDLMFPSILKIKLDEISKYYNFNDSNALHDFISDCKEVLNHMTIVTGIGELIDQYDNFIYEGSQGLLLDKNIGFFPHVTRANVGTKNLPKIDELYYVTRAYQTRHGNGPMTNEDIGHNIKSNPKETNILNYQGEFRRSLLDLDLLEYAIKKDHAKYNKLSLVITCLDHIENDYRFTYRGDIINSLNMDEFVKKICDILKFEYLYISQSEEFKDIERYL